MKLLATVSLHAMGDTTHIEEVLLVLCLSSLGWYNHYCSCECFLAKMWRCDIQYNAIQHNDIQTNPTLHCGIQDNNT